jgi:putative heme-binding domain-containing protein
MAQNPTDTPADRIQGERLFKVQCAACHGPKGAGGAGGPDLTAGRFRRWQSEGQLYQLVLKGLPGTPMPAFAGSSREVWQLVRYVQSLSAGMMSEHAPGDAARGARVFAQSGCRDCHSTLGPDLSNIGSRRSLAALRQAILDPNQDVSPEFWSLRARTKSGQELSGIRLNEDTYSFQFRDAAGLHSVLKEELSNYEIIRGSAMPASQLSTQDLDDVIAYLASLREGGRP